MTDTRSEDNVTRLDRHALETSHADCFETLERYWTRLAGGRIMPLRDELDPRAMAGSLDRIFLLERLAPGVARFRLAGHHLTELMGMDMRGMPLTSFFLPPARDRVHAAVTSLFDEPARIDMTLDGPRQLMRGRMAARLLMLPLRDRDGQATRAIGCLAAGGAKLRAPQRFDIVAEDRQTLVGFGTLPERVVVPKVPPPESKSAPEASRSEPSTPRERTQTDSLRSDVAPGRPPYLRLVVSDT